MVDDEGEEEMAPDLDEAESNQLKRLRKKKVQKRTESAERKSVALGESELGEHIAPLEMVKINITCLIR